MGRKSLTPEQREINRVATVKKYQQSDKYKEYKRQYWLRKKEIITIDTKQKIIINKKDYEEPIN